ncbi:MAG: outer membrane protein assembly factor BamE [Emcibacteraceae bacterium]|nr:outer membrane protein assembly factor BamE [Emcibacteraceae bacterium]
MKKISKTTIIFLSVITVLMGCTSIKNSRGYVPDPELTNAIRVDVDTKDTVASMLGNPTMKPTFDDENWYYYSKRTEQWAFFKERVTEMDILAISFDAENYVSGIRRYSVEDNQIVNPMGKKTVTHGKDVNFFEELFGNVGRFGATGSNPEAGN